MRLSPSTKLRREQRKPFKVGWRVLALVRPSVALPCWRCSSPWIYRPHYNADRRVAGGPKPWRLALYRVGGRVDRGVENQEPCVHNQKKRGVMTTSSILPRISTLDGKNRTEPILLGILYTTPVLCACRRCPAASASFWPTRRLVGKQLAVHQILSEVSAIRHRVRGVRRCIDGLRGGEANRVATRRCEHAVRLHAGSRLFELRFSIRRPQHKWVFYFDCEPRFSCNRSCMALVVLVLVVEQNGHGYCKLCPQHPPERGMRLGSGHRAQQGGRACVLVCQPARRGKEGAALGGEA